MSCGKPSVNHHFQYQRCGAKREKHLVLAQLDEHLDIACTFLDIVENVVLVENLYLVLWYAELVLIAILA